MGYAVVVVEDGNRSLEVRGRRRQSPSLAARPSARGTTRACGTPS